MNEKSLSHGVLTYVSKYVRLADFLNSGLNVRQLHPHLSDTDITELVEYLRAYNTIKFIDMCDSLLAFVLLVVRVEIYEYIGINERFSGGHWLPPGRT
jgi:hypothetical protein